MNIFGIPFREEYLDPTGFRRLSKKESKELSMHREHLSCKECGTYFGLYKAEDGKYICNSCLKKEAKAGAKQCK